MAQGWKGIRCKSFSLPDVDTAGELIISETLDRKTIQVSIRSDTGGAELTTCKVSLTRAQFEALVNMNSTYDGLQVRDEPEPKDETEIEKQPSLLQQ